jgi:pectinesterase inhibitor-like protein
MKNAPRILCAIAVYVAAATMLSTGADAACAREPSMSIAVACNKTTSWQGDLSKAAFQLCMKTLQGAPERSTTTGYSIVAAKAAMESSVATQRTANKLSRDMKLPEILRTTYSSCVDMYDFARSGITAMADALKSCSPRGLERGLGGANAALNDCLQKLRLVEEGAERLPLHSVVLEDRDRIMLAGLMGMLKPE